MGDGISEEQVMAREIILVDQVRSASHSLGTTDLDVFQIYVHSQFVKVNDKCAEGKQGIM